MEEITVPSTTTQAGGQDGSISMGRHQSQCTICQHPHCREIEEAWIHWGYTYQIARDYGVSRDSIYRHAHALKLFQKRQANRKLVYEKIIERTDSTIMNGSTVLAALKTYDKIIAAEEQGERSKNKSPAALLERMTQSEREAFARDGSLPEWFPGAADRTPSERREEEK